MKKRIVFGIVIGCIWALFFVFLGYRQLRVDRIGPVIGGEGPGEISVAEMKQNQAVLLQNMTAMDDRDGNLTDRILVEKVTKSEAGAPNEFSVSYAVFDQAGNLTMAERKISIRDYSEAVFCCDSSLRFEKGTEVQLNGMLSVKDAYDGVMDSNIVYDIPTELMMGEADNGLYEGTASYTNRLGDTAKLQFYVEIYDEKSEMNSYGTSLVLDQYVVYADAEHPFYPEDNLVTIKDNGIAYQVDRGALYRYDSSSDSYIEVDEDEVIHGFSNYVTEAVRRKETGKWMNYRYVDFESDADYAKPGTYVGMYTYSSELTGYVAKALIQIVVR